MVNGMVNDMVNGMVDGMFVKTNGNINNDSNFIIHDVAIF